MKLEQAQMHGNTSARVERDIKELRTRRGEFCSDAACTRTATRFKRDATDQLIGLCAVHGARTPIERRRAMLDELR